MSHTLLFPDMPFRIVSENIYSTLKFGFNFKNFEILAIVIVLIFTFISHISGCLPNCQSCTATGIGNCDVCNSGYTYQPGSLRKRACAGALIFKLKVI